MSIQDCAHEGQFFDIPSLGIVLDLFENIFFNYCQQLDHLKQIKNVQTLLKTLKNASSKQIYLI